MATDNPVAVVAPAFSAEHLHAMANSLDYGVAIISADFTINFVNNWLAKKTGILPAEAVTKNLFELFPSIRQTTFLRQFNKCLQGQGEGFQWSKALFPSAIALVEKIFEQTAPGSHIDRVVCRLGGGDQIYGWLEVFPEERGQRLAPTGDNGRGVAPAASAAFQKTFVARLSSERLGLISVDSYGFITLINEALLELVGFDESDLINKPLRVLFPQIADLVSGENYRTAIEAVMASNSDSYLEAVSVDGAQIKFEIAVFDSIAAKNHLILCCQDVTRANGLFDALQRQRELLSTIFSHVADAILVVDSRGCIENLNPVAEQMLGLGHRRHANTYIDDVLRLRDDNDNDVFPFVEAINRERTINIISGVHLRLLTGVDVPVMVSATPSRDKNNHVIGCVIVMRAVSESRQISNRLSWHESHDPLTQLANRRQMENEVIRAIDNVRVEDASHGFLYIDLYNFSMINDTCGHAAGDELLRQFSRLLTQTVGDFDIAGRTGNDEFAVLLWHRSAEEVREEAEKILSAVTSFSLPWEERRLKVPVSIGVEMITRDSASDVDVMLAAIASCAIARESGRNRIHFPHKGKSVKSRHSLSSWAARISDALDEDRFVVYCQPIVPLQERKEAKHYEALVRMLDKEGNIIPPGNFIAAAEASGFIDDIDKWVFEKILATLDSLPLAKRRQYAFSVNLSGHTISDEKFLKHVVGRVKEIGLEPGILNFEITETAAVKHFDRAVHFINVLRDLGCLFALDDFGSGLSSFGYLKQLPVNFLKIDGSFVRKMELEDVEYSMVSTINHLAHIMGLGTIAECVENQAQMSMLQDMGVDYGQGFFFSVPEPVERIIGG